MKSKILLTILACYASLVMAQDETRYIKFNKENTPTRLKTFHITTIIDDRTDTTNIGTIHAGLTGKKNINLQLQPNPSTALRELLHNTTIQDTSSTPIQIHITSLHATHSRSGLKNRIDLAMGIAFYTKGEKITDYNGDGYSEGIGDPFKPVEELIRKNLQYGLQKFDDWWAKNKNQYMATPSAPLSIKVEASMMTTAPDADWLIYDPKRPLILNDFLGTPDDLSLAAAVTYSGIQMKFSTVMRDGHMIVTVQVFPYFNKLRSWCRKANRNTKTLLHEQKHFDITALKACQLLEALKRNTFTGNFEQELNNLYKQNEKEWDQLQREYDTQTDHGRVAAAQLKWNKWIQDELAKASCFK